MDVKKGIRIIAFLMIFVMLFSAYSYVMMDKTENAYSATLKDEEDNSIDVIFLGSSQMIYGVQPMQLWNDYGIVSYNLATSATTIPMSYWAAKIALEKQNPKYIVLDVAFITTNDKILNYELPRLHALLDNFTFSRNKYLAVKDLVNEEDRLQFYLPVYLYHTRWKGLSQKDFTKLSDNNTKGAHLHDGVVDFENYFQRVDSEVKDDFNPIAKEYILKLNDLCKENGIQLILTAIPTLHSSGAQGMFHTVADVASANQIEFINGYEDSNYWGLDYATDFFDGAHVNLRGSEKITKYIGEYLKENCSILDHRNEDKYRSWDEAYEDYLKFKNSIHVYPEYSFGENISFGTTGNAGQYFVSGLKESQHSDFTWSNGKRSDAFFYLNEKIDLELKCQIAYVKPLRMSKERVIEIYFNNQYIDSVKLDSSQESIVISTNISKEYINYNGFQQLTLKYIDIDQDVMEEQTIALKNIILQKR